MVRVKKRKGMFEVYFGGELYETFHLEEEAQLYAELLESNLDWNGVRLLIRNSLEEHLGGCEVLSLYVDFPHLCYEILVKGKEIVGELELRRGILKSESKVAKAVLFDLSRFFGFPISLSTDTEKERKRTEKEAGKVKLLF